MHHACMPLLLFFFFSFMHGPFCTLQASLIQSVFVFLPPFSPVYDKFITAETFTNSNYACLEIPRLITVCRAAAYSCALWVIYYCTHKYISIYLYLYIFFACTNLANTTTNILITSIIIQIPEGNFPTCRPPFLPANPLPRKYFLQAVEAKTFS